MMKTKTGPLRSSVVGVLSGSGVLSGMGIGGRTLEILKAANLL